MGAGAGVGSFGWDSLAGATRVAFSLSDEVLLRVEEAGSFRPHPAPTKASVSRDRNRDFTISLGIEEECACESFRLSLEVQMSGREFA
jgi:hypothetical protein